ncbi:xanthine dehydrogenase family protein molybdopterin-binding subunit [Nocardioides sp. NPDC051685]|uniref:xanthine dehydrogenase family protein molybdopterin-binding subunit n=1 Tax=Nocardioides sp. NPDC051685 TaxID=3364334 RepID=UPI00378D685B
MSSATETSSSATNRQYVGESVPRREDFRFLTGTGTFSEDISLTGMLYASMVRSTLAHADIVSIDTEAARAQPGVVAVFTAADFGDQEMGTIPTDWTLPIMDGIPDRYPLARNAVKYVGEAVAVVIAETRAQADDATCFVDVEYLERPVVVDTEAAASEGAPLVHERYERNTSYLWHLGTGDWDTVAAAADHVVDLRLVNQRVHASSLEARVSIADYAVGTDSLTLYLGTQNVHVVRRNLSIAIGIPENRIRVVTPAVGGAFGSKLCLYPEDVVVSAVSRRLRRPVRWAESRAEHFTGTSGGRDHVEYVSIAADKSGKIQGLKVTTYANLGAYVSGMGAGIPVVSGMVFPGVYDIPVADVDIHGVFTNTSTTETYRGAGRPEATYLIERAVDELAAKIGIDRVELRRRNFIQPDQFPYSNATGMTYDSGDYEKALDKALDMIGWDKLLAEHDEARSRGRIVGLGVSVYTEFCGFGDAFQLQLVGFDRATWEQSVITVTRTGSVIVQVGIDAAGQGHETSIAQIVATELGLDIDDVEVLQGDTDIVHFGTGTFNSRSMSSAGSAAALAARKIMAKATRLAAHMLGVEIDDVAYESGVFVRRDGKGRQLSFEDVAVEAWRGVDLPEGMEPTLKEMAVFDPPAFTSPFGVHLAAVEIDPDTGAITIDRYVAVDDSGHLINPTLATGQIHGGVAQGIGQALYENLAWDEDGQPASASFMQYAVPRAHQMPQLETGHTVTPSPINPLGVKGVGESGAIGSQPAVVNAVMDAVRRLGVENLDMPLTPAKVWMALQEATK